MSWNINTPDGLKKSQRWFEQYTSMLSDGAVWLIPRAGSVYRIHTKTKVIELVTGSGDLAMEEVAESLGWSLMTQN